MPLDPDLVSIQEVRTKIERAYSAWTRYRGFSQEQVDAVVEAAAAAARAESQRLADLAVKETGYGNAKDKLAKNLLAAEILPQRLRGLRTIGVLRENRADGIVEIGVPMGVVGAILPSTNPTSTVIYKTLIALKAGCAIVLSPHPRARGCSCETAAVLAEAAVKAGAPQGIIECIGSSTIETTNELMHHRRLSVILSTGGSGIVRAAYSSGKPAYGVGPGNVPILVDTSADIEAALKKVVEGKSFDYGTLCSSEQTLVAERGLRDRILAALRNQHAFVCFPSQSEAVAKLLVGPKFSINPDCVGQSAVKIARMAGFEVPADTTILAVEIEGVGRQHPLSAEKLSPVLSLYFVENWAAALDACEAVLRFGGLGHTCGIYAKDDARIREYASRMPAFRVVANTSTPQGSTGITTNLFPAMTLGCGAAAGNITSDNITPNHLVNVKRLAYPRGSEPVSGAAPPRSEVTAAVDRYLARRGGTPEVAAAPVPPPAPAISTPAPAGPPATPPAPPSVAAFVCEDDVRQAVREGRKIFIGPKTIVTPSARDLGADHDILVMTK